MGNVHIYLICALKLYLIKIDLVKSNCKSGFAGSFEVWRSRNDNFEISITEI
jgi:hypothetical protein